MDESMSALSLSSTKTITSKNHPPRRRRTPAEHQEKTDQRQEKIKDNNVVPNECIVEARQVLIETITFIAEEVYLKISVPNGETTMLKYSTYGNIQKYIPTIDRCVHGIWRLILYTKNGDTLSKKSVFEKNIAESGKYIFIIEENYEIKFIVHETDQPKIIQFDDKEHSRHSNAFVDGKYDHDDDERAQRARINKINRKAQLNQQETLSLNYLALTQQQLDEAGITTGPPCPSCIKLCKKMKQSIAALDQKMNVILSKMKEIMSSKKEEQFNGKNECATNEKIIETTSTSMNYEASATSVDQKLNIILSLLLPSNSMSASMGIQPQQQCSQQQVHQYLPENHQSNVAAPQRFQYTLAPTYTVQQADCEKAIVYHRNANQPFIEADGSCVPQQQVHQYTREIQQAHVAVPQRFQYAPAPTYTVQQADNEKAIVYHRNASQPFIEAAESCVPRPLEGMYTMEAVGSSMDGGGSFTVTTVRSASEEIYTSPGIISSNETSKMDESMSALSSQPPTTTSKNHPPRPVLDGEIYQLFSLPENIIYYIAMNPSNAEVYKKLIRTCKYFFNKNPILVVDQLCYTYERGRVDIYEWKVSFTKSSDSKKEKIDMDMIRCPLWITDCFEAGPCRSEDERIAASIVPKIYKCDAEHISLIDQVITLDDFLLLASNAQNCQIYLSLITENDGKTPVMFEKIIEQLPKLQVFYFRDEDGRSISSNTVAALLQIPHFSNIVRFEATCLPQRFDVKAFFDYIKTRNNLSVLLMHDSKLDGEVSEQYEKQMNEIVDEIISTRFFTYMPPCIFDMQGRIIDDEKFDLMEKIGGWYQS